MALDLSMPVLVVDDYSTMVRIIRNLLAQLGFGDVDDAKDGASALEKMRIKRYGLVISDWNMEPMTGYDLLKEVRADPGLGIYRKLVITDGRLVGSVLYGDTTDALWYLNIIRSGTPTDSYREDLVFGRALAEQQAA